MVAAVGATEIDDHDIARLDHPVGRMVMRRGAVRARADNGHARHLVALLDEHGGDGPRQLGLGPTREPGPREARRDTVGGSAGAAKQGDLVGRLDQAECGTEAPGRLERRSAHRLLELQEKHRPGLIPDRSPRRRAREVGDDLHRVLRLTPRADGEGVGMRHDLRRLELRHNQRGFAFGRDDRHRQALQQRRVVPGEVHEIHADGHEQRVDA